MMKENNKEIKYLSFIQVLFTVILTFTVVMTGRYNPNIYAVNSNEDVTKPVTTEGTTTVKVKKNESTASQTQENTTNDVAAVMASADTGSEITAPVHGEITSRFGGRTNPITGLYAEHTGIDIAAKQGTDILAAYKGVVEETGKAEKAGNYILLLHSDGSETLYCHCSEICAKEGELVRAGNVIAKVGSTGWSTGAHLHFEIKIDGESVDPLEYLDEKDGCV